MKQFRLSKKTLHILGVLYIMSGLILILFVHQYSAQENAPVILTYGMKLYVIVAVIFVGATSLRQWAGNRVTVEKTAGKKIVDVMITVWIIAGMVVGTLFVLGVFRHLVFLGLYILGSFFLAMMSFLK